LTESSARASVDRVGVLVHGSHVVAALQAPRARSHVDRALAAQSQHPAQVFHGHDAVVSALASGAPWIWLLDARAAPRPDALERLLECAAPAGERPASVLAGMVIDAAGAPVGRALPAGGGRSLADVVRLTGRGLLPIRHTTFANCLVARECLVREGLPDIVRFGPYADAEWSARALRRGVGYLVPASVVVLERGRAGRRAALGSIPALVRMTRTGTWTRGETLGAASAIAREAIDARREPGASSTPRSVTEWDVVR
jgi:GT2 family glycosyltransferase